MSDVPPTVSDPNISENPNSTAVDLENVLKNLAFDLGNVQFVCFENFRDFSNSSELIRSSSKQLVAADCIDDIQVDHLDYLVNQLII